MYLKRLLHYFSFCDFVIYSVDELFIVEQICTD